MFLFKSLIIVIIAGLVSIKCLNGQQSCSYEKKCNSGDPNKINVHIISHTHDDAGWLKTVDEYYIGSRKYIDRGGVQYIIDSVLKNLYHNPHRKFSYVEGTYMQRWLSENEHYRHLFKKFVLNGQMEVLSGGWVMNDEACTHYLDIINQMTLGFKTYKDAFEDCGIPRTGWQIDPFGHSAAQADLFAQMGFDGMFYGRVSDKLKNHRSGTRSLEFMWEPMPNFYDVYSHDYHNQSDPDFFKIHRHSAQLSPNLFIGILPNLYQPPPGFCFDIFCDDEPIQDDPSLSGYNKDQKVNSFISQMLSQARFYDTNHLVVTMGNDFNYQAAENWYKNLDKLITYVNQEVTHPEYQFNLFYSTPGCYLYSLSQAKKNGNVSGLQSVKSQASAPSQQINLRDIPDNPDPGHPKALTLEDYNQLRKVRSKEELEKALSKIAYDRSYQKASRVLNQSFSPRWPVKKGGDFFPLVNFGINFWTGYFTSRPTLKGMIRDGSAFLQICKQIEALSGHSQPIAARELDRAIGIAQHHDAVTGTAKQAVTYDYILRLHKGILACQDTIKEGLTKLGVIKNENDIQFCHLLNISVCHFTQSSNKRQFSVLLYNPLGWEVSKVIQIPVHTYSYHVYDPSGKEIPSQTENVPQSVFRIPERYIKSRNGGRLVPKDRQTDLSLSFKITVPALGTSRYLVKLKSDFDSRGDRRKRSYQAPNNQLKKLLKSNETHNSNVKNSVDSDNSASVDDKVDSILALLQFDSTYLNNTGDVSVDDIKMALIRSYSSEGMLLADLVPEKNDISNNNIYDPNSSHKNSRMNDGDAGKELFIENKRFKVTFDPVTQRLERLENKLSKISTDIDINYFWYGQPIGTVSRTSGAYLFRSNAPAPNNITRWSNIDFKLNLVKGKVFQQAQIQFASWLYVELTLYQDVDEYLELAWTVGSIPVINDSTPKDIVLKITSDINSMVRKSDDDIDDPNTRFGYNVTNFNKFYTDSNGRFMVPRYVNMEAYQQSFSDKNSNFIPMQYYPINTKIYVKDENAIQQQGMGNSLSKRQLGVVTDRAQGATSLNNGDIEIMVHRRTLIDDSLGVGEPLNELGYLNSGLIARGKHYIVFENSVYCNEVMTRLAQEIYLRPQIMFSPITSSTNENSVEANDDDAISQFIKSQLPRNVHLLTLSRWFSRTPKMLLRFENYYSPGEHPDLSTPATINLKDLFKTFTVHTIKELALGANQDLSKVQRFEWPYASSQSDSVIIYNANDTLTGDDAFQITLHPMEIRTFILDIEYHL